MLKRTSLFEEHQKLGGRLIDFGGWELPVQYSGVIGEHLACRSAAGLFDVSHMGEIRVEGKDAESFLNYLVTNNVANVSQGQAQYTVMCNERGGIIDDLIIYKRAPGNFLLVVNASNTEKDFDWIHGVLERNRQRFPDAQVANQSAQWSQIAIQGPKAAEILQKLTRIPLAEIKTYWFAEGEFQGGVPAIFARTGYTGEDGFEIYSPWKTGPEIWRALLESGTNLGLKPCGLGARDTLRLEMRYPLYGHELNEEIHPLEAGLGWVTKLDKGDFVGRESLLRIKEQGLKRRLVGLKLLERGIPRQGYAVFDADGMQKIGELTSGTQSPSLKVAIGVAYVTSLSADPGNRITVDIRGTKVPAEIIPTPFYQRTN